VTGPFSVIKVEFAVPLYEPEPVPVHAWNVRFT